MGQAVEVLVMPTPSNGQTWGDGLRRCAGYLVDDWSDDDDRLLALIQQERRCDGRPELSE
jgi:hypothetical protein